MEKKKRVFHIVFIVLLVAWMVVIFCFSAKPRNVSSSQSKNIGRMICRIFISDFDELSEAEQLRYISKIDHPVRKAAHFTEYTILGVLSFLAIGIFKFTKKPGWRMLAAFLLSAFYAGTDEFHQLFVPGRGCLFTDVLIDSSGATLGILICALILLIKTKRKTKQNLNKYVY